MKLFKEPKEISSNNIWLIIVFAIILGFVLIGFVSYKGKDYLITFGAAMLTGCACFGLGAMGGFLFGIPRIMSSTSNQTPVKAVSGTVMHNDNLVQISDWITKIIVGVGLTQLNEIPGILQQIGKFLAPCFYYTNNGKIIQTPEMKEFASMITICVVLYFIILGFMACYLWTRFHFSEMLKDTLDDNDPKIEAQATILNEGEGDININL